MTNRQNYVKLAEGIRAAGRISAQLQHELYFAALKHVGPLNDFSTDKFTEHALSKSPINPQRILRHLNPDIDGFTPAIAVRADVPDYAYGVYLKDDDNTPYLNRYAASQLAYMKNGEAENETWLFDEDDRLLVVGPDSTDLEDEATDVYMPNEHGMYRIPLTTWEVV